MTQSHTPGLEAVVLAAGQGARFGGDKLLAPLKGAPLVKGAIATALAAPVRRVFVAVGSDPRLNAAIESIAADLGKGDRVVLVPVPDAHQGMGVSLRTAAAALPADATGAFVFLGDMPRVAPETAWSLAAALATPEGIVVPIHAGRRGHPVLFGARWLGALGALDGDEGGRALIVEAGARLVMVEVDDGGVHLDIDRPEDLARIL